MKPVKIDNDRPRWSRRRILAFLPAVIGGLAARGGVLLTYKRPYSGRKADHWEKVKD